MDIITGAKYAILIGAGEIDCSMADRIKKHLSENKFVIALDGGLKFCAEHDIEPDMIVGDFDSLIQENNQMNKQQYVKPQQPNIEMDLSAKNEILARYPQEIIHRLPCEKDDTDTLAAIKMAIKKGFTHFTIYGGLGGRLSHTIANIQSLYYLKEQGLHGELVGDNSRVFLIKNESITIQPLIADTGTAVYPVVKKEDAGGYISIFSYSEKAQGVTLKNLKYEITDAELTNSFPIGVSNEFVGKEAEIIVNQGTLLVIIESEKMENGMET